MPDGMMNLRNEVLEEAAEIVDGVANEMRACDGTWPEEYSTREVRDALYSAASRILAARA